MQKNILKIVLSLFLISLVAFSISYGSQSLMEAKKKISVGLYEEAIQILNNVVLENPENAEAFYLLGKAYLFSNEEESAIESFERSINAKKRQNKVLALSFRELGEKYAIEYGELDLAKKIFDYTVIIDPKENKRIANILIKQGEKIRNTDCYFASTLFNLATRYMEDKEKKLALIFEMERINQKETMKIMRHLADSINMYIKDNGFAPAYKENLSATSLFYSSLISYMQDEHVSVFDCWNNPFFIISGEPDKKDYLIISSGRDGIREDNIPAEKIIYSCTELSDFNDDIIMKNGDWIKVPKIDGFNI